MYIYYVVYKYWINSESGTGSCVAETSLRCDSWEIIQEIAAQIAKENGFSKVIILDWKELKS